MVKADSEAETKGTPAPSEDSEVPVANQLRYHERGQVTTADSQVRDRLSVPDLSNLSHVGPQSPVRQPDRRVVLQNFNSNKFQEFYDEIPVHILQTALEILCNKIT